MPAPTAALLIFVGVFAVAAIRGVHLGIVMVPAACVAGVVLAGLSVRDVLGGFPVGILVLVGGVTYFFGIAQLNGTVDRLIALVLARAGARRANLPVIFFALAAGASAMGSPQAGLVTGPVGMAAASRARIDVGLMAIAINSGISAGAFAPTSLFGLITYRIAREAGIELHPLTLLAVAVAANLAVLFAALLALSRPSSDAAPDSPTGGHPGMPARPIESESPDGGTTAPPHSSGIAPTRHDQGGPESISTPSRSQMLTMLCMLGLVASIVVCAVVDLEPDIGVIALGLGSLMALADPALGRKALVRIDWSTAFLVGGIVTFVGVLQRLGSVEMLGRAAMDLGTPMMAAILVCMVAALVSAFASTTGVLAALVPMAVPLAASGEIAGWALITALGVCATIVDASPFSNTGATLIAAAAEEERPRLRVVLLRWGMAMVVVGPLVLVPLLASLGGP